MHVTSTVSSSRPTFYTGLNESERRQLKFMAKGLVAYCALMVLGTYSYLEYQRRSQIPADIENQLAKAGDDFNLRNRLCFSYEMGKEYKKAVECFKIGAVNGHARSMKSIDGLRDKTKIPEFDFIRTRFEMAVDEKITKAEAEAIKANDWLILGQVYLNEGLELKAIEYYRRAADKGDLNAWNALERLMSDKDLCKKNRDIAAAAIAEVRPAFEKAHDVILADGLKIACKENKGKAWAMLGMLYYRRGKYRETVGCFLMEAEAKPRFSEELGLETIKKVHGFSDQDIEQIRNEYRAMVVAPQSSAPQKDANATASGRSV